MKILQITLLLLLSINNKIFAETIYTEGALNYVIRDGSIVVVGYFGTEKEVVVPDQIGGCVVTGVASGALTKECIEKVVLPETITAIEEGAIIEHAKVNVEDSYGNTIKEDDISDIEVEDDFFIESEEYDSLQELDNTDDDIFVDEQEDINKENNIIDNEDLEEVYSAKVSTIAENNDYPLIIVCVVVIVCVILFVTLKKRKK